MLQRQTSGSVVCPTCGRLVGVRDERCFNCGRWNPGLWGYSQLLGKLGRDFGFVPLVIGGCIALFVATLLYAPEEMGMRGILSFLSPGGEALFRFGMSGAMPVFGYGRWWTVLSAAWLHGGALHILFNLLWIRQMAPAVAELYGVGRLVIIYTVSSVAGFALTSVVGLFVFLPGFLRGALYTVGASAPLFGLFGALVLYGHRTGNRAVGQQVMQFVVIWVVFGFVAALAGPGGIRIDNWAHLGGFGGGYLAARWLDPLRPEQPQHVIAALGCLAAMALSIVASFLAGGSFGR